MPVILNELLQPQLILDLISRVRPGQGALGPWLGFQPNKYDPENVALTGPATITGNLRNTVYRIFNVSRTVAHGRAPGTGPAVIPQNPMGQVPVTCARFHEKLPLNYEFLGNLSPMIGPNSQIDPSGQDYVRRQTTFLATRAARVVEMLAAAMMRDSLYLIQEGDNWNPRFTAPTGTEIGFQINFQIPAGNKNQLDMLGAGNIIGTSWANLAAPIFSDIMKIQSAYTQLNGYALTDVWINGTLWPNIVQNTQIRNLGGTAQTPFSEFTREPEKGMDGKPSNRYFSILRGIPWLRWHLLDDVLSLGSDIDIKYTYSTGSAAKLIPDNMAIFCTEPSVDIAKMYLGGEPVVENPGMPAVVRSGYYFWHEYTTQPSAIDLIALVNCVPCLFIPDAFAPATVVF